MLPSMLLPRFYPRNIILLLTSVEVVNLLGLKFPLWIFLFLVVTFSTIFSKLAV